MRLYTFLIIAILVISVSAVWASNDVNIYQTTQAVTADTSETVNEGKNPRFSPEGDTGRIFAAEHKKQSKTSNYSSWKRHLSFWPRKALILFELLCYIIVGVLIGQALEVSGVVRWLSVLTLPMTGLGRLSRESGPAFLMAFQSGAVANSMLVSNRDTGQLNNRELYTAVFIVSALSLFAHLPTFVVPIGMAFGWEATAALFGVRFVAIVAQIIITLVVSRLIIIPLGIGEKYQVINREQPGTCHKKVRQKGTFWSTVWKRSRYTLTRLIFYLIPTFTLMATLEYFGVFRWLAQNMPHLFTFDFLPAQSLVVIPAQALSLYNGAIAAANFIDSGAITTHQAVIIILFGSMVTAPIRTLKHALPTYIAILGPRPGTIMAVSAQVIRMLFLLLCTLGLMSYWF